MTTNFLVQNYYNNKLCLKHTSSIDSGENIPYMTLLMKDFQIKNVYDRIMENLKKVLKILGRNLKTNVRSSKRNH